MDQVTVTIGRKDNVNGLELSNSEWAQFAELVRDLLTHELGACLVVDSEGFGEWEGQSEPNRHVVGIREVPFSEADKVLAREHCAHLAFVFDQDAIALGFGTSELVESDA